MALQQLKASLVYPARPDGGAWSTGTGGTTTLDAAGEYVCLVLVARQAMTISHVGLFVQAVAGSPTGDIRIETVDPTTGLPSGTLWGTNTNIVTATLTTGFALHALTASATIAAGDIFAVKFAYNSGTSYGLRIAMTYGLDSWSLPYIVTNTGTPTKAVMSGPQSGVVLGSSSTAFYAVRGLQAAGISTATTTAFTNADGARRAARFRLPFPARCVGIVEGGHNANAVDIIAGIYDDAGTELSNSLTSFDGDNFTGAGPRHLFFDNPVTLAKDTWYRAAIIANSASNTRCDFATLDHVNYMAAWPGGADWHLATYTTAGGWVDTATSSIPAIAILIDQLDDGASAGGGAPGHGNMTGGMQ